MEKPPDNNEERKKLEKLADELNSLQKDKYEGRGVECVRSIIFYLKRGDLKSARAICFHESDKFYGLDDIKDFIIKELFKGEKHPWWFTEELKRRTEEFKRKKEKKGS